MPHRLKILLVALIFNSAVESWVQTLRIHRSSSSTSLKSFVSDVPFSNIASSSEVSGVNDVYPIFSLPRKVTFKSKCKRLLDNSLNVLVFTAILFKSMLIQPAHAVSRSSVVPKTSATTLRSATEETFSKMSIKKRVIGITFGLATALGVVSFRKREDLKNMQPLSFDKIDPLTSKAKDLIAKAKQLEEDLSREQSLSEMHEGVLDFTLGEDVENKITNEVVVNLADIEEIVTNQGTDDINILNQAKADDLSKDVVHMEEWNTLEETPNDVDAKVVIEHEEESGDVKDVIEQEEESDLNVNNYMVAKDDMKSETLEGHDVEINDTIPKSVVDIDAEKLESLDVEEVVDVKITTTSHFEEFSNPDEVEPMKEIKVLESDNAFDPTDVKVEREETAFDYSAIEDPSERAFRILVNLGMVKENQDPNSADYDHADDDEFAVENKIVS